MPTYTPLVADLLSKTLRLDSERIRISETQGRICRFLSPIEVDTVISEAEFKDSLWGHHPKTMSDTYRVTINKLCNKVAAVGSPPIIVRERKIGWRRTGVPITIVNPPPDTPREQSQEQSGEISDELSDEISDETADLLTALGIPGVSACLANESVLLDSSTWKPALVYSIARWQSGRKVAREGKSWVKEEREIDIRDLFLQLPSLELDKNIVEDMTPFGTILRTDERFEWLLTEFRVRAGFTEERYTRYVLFPYQVVMSYDTWLTLAYEVMLPLGMSEWTKEMDHTLELYYAIEAWHPGIDGVIPFGRAVVRYGA